ncbi:hypothetical protein XO10_00195 [Marinitoga sp. 1135]|uniref:HAD-superfamily hydrolase, subfamily IIB n=1 Tax=Marinitoga piezophila (strain DSM 14283 / JCM 11233 / KA3) TaxID=443254 RepID=H2J2Q5_MARPK|nr:MULTISPECIES: Cof-type HAD-IIB family hydrolase [Marinitoga]AEX84499.1 HAD-superfamily hydrolase, subfamily IIB [Marinitoga piezophila KA3]APT74994.1 hypothetical protein LN42_00195 [Marinitoga sp. 1137]NUU94750.1 hypothetical protein [Marinitoga sp. 1135]NUU96679.1 hypothetical protein [Marinitoga sp. 1138]
MHNKTFIFDLDGTLLNSNESISQRTVESIKKIFEMGSFIIIASGRMYKSTRLIVEKYMPFLHNNIPIVSYNGAYVVSHTGEVVFESDILKDLAIKVIEDLKKHDTHVQIYLNDDLITDKDNDEIKQYAKHSGVEYKIVKDIVEHIKQHGEPTKILAINQPEKLDIIQKSMTEKYGNTLNIVRSFSIYLDFLNKDSSKGLALKKLKEIYRFNLEEAYIFGDSENDISMLSLSKNSYAMANANEHVKESARNITLSNDEEGVAIVLEKIISNFSNSN